MKDEKANCPNCGRALAFNDARFCTSCGASITADGTVATQAGSDPAVARSRETQTGIEKIDLDLDAKPDGTAAEAPQIEIGGADDWEIESARPQPVSPKTKARRPTSPSGAKPPNQPNQPGPGSPDDATSRAAVLNRGKDDQMVNQKPPVQEKRTIVEEGTRLKGELESDCPVVVNGHVAGAVQAPALTVSATGVVDGTARVGTIQCQGELAGEFDADRVELSGSVKDGTVIRAETIEMKLTAKGGKKQLVFGDVQDTARAQTAKTEASSDESPPPSDEPGEAPASDRGQAVPVNGRPSQPPPPAN